MRITFVLTTLLFFSGARLCPAQDNASQPAKVPAVKQAQESSPDVLAIRDTADLFSAAFNKQDAKALAALWTEDGEYIDDSGRVLLGRDAIEKDYQDFFANNPGAKIQITIDSVRLLGAGTAIEDGHASMESPTGDAGPSAKYTVIHTKVGNRWLMASVRDAVMEPPADAASAADLMWLIGTWVAEEHGIKTESICSWVVDGRFIERRYKTTQLDGTVSSGLQLIGWNPQGGHVQSWSFSPDGGHVVGIWTPMQNGWTAQMQGVTGDGEMTTSINQLRRLDDNAHVWQSIQRTVNGTAIPDTDEIIMKRVPLTH